MPQITTPPHTCPPSGTYRGLAWLAAGTLAIVILTGLFELMVFSDVFHNYEHRRLGTEDRLHGISPHQFTDELQMYFLSSDMEWVQHAYLSYRERLHYQEVKELMKLPGLGFLASSALAAGFSLWLFTGLGPRYTSKYQLGSSILSRTAVILLATMTIFGLLSLNFDRSFLGLHRLLFEGTNWALPPSSLTIKMYPAQYFFDFFLIYCALVVALALTILGGVAIVRKQRSGH